MIEVAEDFMRMERKERRSTAHKKPELRAVTVAARGFEYMRASSPKHACVLYCITSTF